MDNLVYAMTSFHNVMRQQLNNAHDVIFIIIPLSRAISKYYIKITTFRRLTQFNWNDFFWLVQHNFYLFCTASWKMQHMFKYTSVSAIQILYTITMLSFECKRHYGRDDRLYAKFISIYIIHTASLRRTLCFIPE